MREHLFFLFDVTNMKELVEKNKPITEEEIKSYLDGEDLIESMFAFHNMVARSSRSELVIGPLKKGRVNWLFNVDQEALDRVSPVGKSGSQTLAEAVHRVKTFRYELYRGEIEQNA